MRRTAALAALLTALAGPASEPAHAARDEAPVARPARPASPDSLGQVPVILHGETLGDRFGDPVVRAGDVNGDGFDDLLIGAWNYSVVGAEAGRVYVYLGGPAGVDSTPDWVKTYPTPGAKFGMSLACVGDLDADGFDDILVGAGRDMASQQGSAHLFRGGPSGPDTTAAWSAIGASTYSWFGTAVAGAGDLNDDGHPDIAIGAPNAPGVLPHPGAVFVYYGTGTGLAPTPTVLQGDLDAGWFGYSVAGAGDVNGDGVDDLIVGAPYTTDPLHWEGRAQLFLGSPSGVSTTPAWSVNSGNLGAGFGYSVGGAGDVNADGFGDVLVGAHHFDTTGVAPQEGQGRAFLFFGSPTGLSPTAPWWITGHSVQAHLGRTVGFAGDVNHDGIDDLYLSSLREAITQFSEGRLEIFYGRAGVGPSTIESWGYSPGERTMALGQSMAANMDLNGDGAVDVAGGSSGPSEGPTATYGYVYLLYGIPGALDAPPPAPADGLALSPPSPNPLVSGGSATARFTLPRAARVRLAMFDAHGREVAAVLDRALEAGTHRVTFRGLDRAGAPLAPGLYFLGLDVEGSRRASRLAIVR
ncbi:MAG: FG-GAP repeat protein [Candidatus Eisenbacteria bacterium]|nr:FG-GAP repeat protein [Candidatus Eisenbacteria bacterium]